MDITLAEAKAMQADFALSEVARNQAAIVVNLHREVQRSREFLDRDEQTLAKEKTTLTRMIKAHQERVSKV